MVKFRGLDQVAASNLKFNPKSLKFGWEAVVHVQKIVESWTAKIILFLQSFLLRCVFEQIFIPFPSLPHSKKEKEKKDVKGITGKDDGTEI